MTKYSIVSKFISLAIGSLAALSFPAVAQELDLNRALSQALGKVVHLRVTGKPSAGEHFSIPLHGTGVIIKTDSPMAQDRFRILTAGHVVLRDDFWNPLGSRRNRDVYITVEANVAAQELRPVTGVAVSPDLDVAQIAASSRAKSYAKVKSISLAKGQKYAVVTWGLDSGRVSDSAIAKEAEVIGLDPYDARLVRVKGKFFPTESGSPLFDANGDVVGILVLREVVNNESNTALVLPVSAMHNWINGVRSQPVSVSTKQKLIEVKADAEGLCIFLGKKSALNRENLRYPDAPFGRNVLQAISLNLTDDRVVGALLKIKPQTGAINVRSKCPEVEESKAYYGSIVTVLDPKAEVRVSNIQAQKYLNDIFYWGTISSISADE